jgi:hypothetical protein
MKEFATNHPIAFSLLVSITTTICVIVLAFLLAMYAMSADTSPPPHDSGAMAAGMLIYLGILGSPVVGLIVGFAALVNLKWKEKQKKDFLQ